jgi:hypothetical protein
MFGRRKTSDGFEWHKYVRTTIKLRREERRQRIQEARRAAVHQAGAASVALAETIAKHEERFGKIDAGPTLQ